MNITALVAALNACVGKLDALRDKYGIPRLRATHHIGLARCNGKVVTAEALRAEGWPDPDGLAARLNVISDELESLPDGMSRARAIKLINGGARYFNKDNNQVERVEGDPAMAPPEITEAMVQSWAENKEAAA